MKSGANLNGSGQPQRRPNGHMHETECTCPTCGSMISEVLHTAILGRQRAHDAEIEKAIETRFAKQMAETNRKRKSEIDAAVREAIRVADAKLTAMREAQETTISTRLEVERQKAAKAIVDAVNAEKVRHFDEKLRLESQLSEMQRKLAAKPAHQIGEPAEIDLFDALVAAFPGDRISRVGKGQRGPDVRVEVMLPNGERAGLVILDSKAHARWSNKFTTKLRADQLAEKADFAVLVSSAFPSGSRELHMQDNVLVVAPGRAVIVVQFLRQQVLTSHRLKLSVVARDEKGDRLLAFLTSPAASDHFDQLAQATDDMIDLEARELDIQTGIHRKRGEMIRTVQRVHEDLVSAIEGIIGGNEPVDPESMI